MAKLELLASGLGFLEGPRYEPSSGGLYFSDVHGGGVHRLNPDGSFTVAIPKRRGVGGVALHARGGVVAGGRTICHVVDGKTRILYGADDIPGFNDLFVDGKGRVITGTMRDDPFGDKEANQRTTGECIRITAEGQAEVLYTDVALTNGIGFSPDGKRIYHSDSARQHVIVHTVNDDDTVTGRGVLWTSTHGVPDGLAVSEDNNVWVALAYGSCVVRLSPVGTIVEQIDVPAKAVTSLCFGGADGRDLYIVTADNTDDAARKGCIFRTRVDVAGVPVPMATI